MAIVKKLVNCRCGKSSLFEINTELNVEDVTIFGTCPACGANIQVTMSALLKEQGQQAQQSSTSQEQSSSNSLEHMSDEDVHGVDYSSMRDENFEAAVNEIFNQ
jgi:hypothetical protein